MSYSGCQACACWHTFHTPHTQQPGAAAAAAAELLLCVAELLHTPPEPLSLCC